MTYPAQSSLRRSITLFRIFRRYRLWQVIANYSHRPFLKYGDAFAPRTALPLGDRLCQAFQEAGPLFIKLGQALSTRPDLISPEIAQSLSLLQDKLPAFPSDQAIAIIEAALKKPLDTIFSTFEREPLGSASVAQVHGARLSGSDESVVIKILRPDIHALIQQDLRLLRQIIRLTAFQRSLSHLQLPRVLDELECIFDTELNLMKEAANSAVFKRQCAKTPFIHIPKVYWDHTARTVATFERIPAGIRLNDIAGLMAAQVDTKQVAQSLLSFLFTQIFEHGYFHADLHPGNVWITPSASQAPRLALVDFGIMATLSTTDQRYLAQNLMAFIDRDYRQVAALHIESGWVPAKTRSESFESALRAVCEPLFERSIESASFGSLLSCLFQTAQSFQMQLQPQLILLQKTILNAEGLARQLDPQLNVWATLEPIMRTWMKKTLSLKSHLRLVKKQLPYWITRFIQHAE